MAKGYLIAHMRVTDPERYKDYVAANGPVFEKYNARFVVRGGDWQGVEAEMPYDRHVILEFESLAQAKACYHSPEYQAAAAIRQEASEGYVVIVEGHGD